MRNILVEGCTMVPFYLLAITLAAAASERKDLSIVIDEDGNNVIKENSNPKADVQAYFIDSMNETGWGILEVKINVIDHGYAVSDGQRMLAAGIAEGYLTSLGIHQSYENMKK